MKAVLEVLLFLSISAGIAAAIGVGFSRAADPARQADFVFIALAFGGLWLVSVGYLIRSLM